MASILKLQLLFGEEANASAGTFEDIIKTTRSRADAGIAERRQLYKERRRRDAKEANEYISTIGELAHHRGIHLAAG